MTQTANEFQGFFADFYDRLHNYTSDAEGFAADLREQYGISSISPTDDIAIRAARLPDFHKDPADRIIIATALVHDLTVVTGDVKFPQYGVRTIS